MSKITLNRVRLFFKYLLGDTMGLIIVILLSAALAAVAVSLGLIIANTVLSFFKSFGFAPCFAWTVYIASIVLISIPSTWTWIKMHWENSGESNKEENS